MFLRENKENFYSSVNSLIEPYQKKSKTINNDDVRDQLIQLSEKILEKDCLLQDLKLVNFILILKLFILPEI